MRRLLLAVLALSLTAAPAAARPANGLDVTSWVLPSSPSRVVANNAGGLTTLAVSATMLRASGHAVTPVNGDMLRLARAGRAHHLATELALSNYSNPLEAFDAGALHRLLSDPGAIRKVVAAVAHQVARGPWDGVNVDFELVRASDGAGLTRFVAQLQSAMPRSKTVSIDISASGTVAIYRHRGYRLGLLRRHVDVVDLMAYDYSGPTWTGPGPIGPLDWQRRSVEALLRAVPASKVQLGVAGYGYTWPANGTGTSVTDRQARRLVADDSATPTWMPDEGEWTATLSDGTVLWWSDARSYDLRVTLAQQLHLRGTAVWRLGSSDRLA